MAAYQTIWVHGFFLEGQNQLLAEIYLPPMCDVDAHLANRLADNAAT